MIIATVVGARPQFIKAAMLARELTLRRGVRHVLIHSGQHSDPEMSEIFFQQLEIPAPDVHLGVAGGPHGRSTGRMLEAVEGALERVRPDWVVVPGDTNSTLAGALAAAKLGLRVAHVEAGLRSGDRRMAEEINRIVADHVSELLLAPTEAAVANLAREGLQGERVALVGDVMSDAALHYRGRSAAGALRAAGVEPGGYVLATVHRAENTDDPARLASIMEGLGHVAERMPVVLPLHPRTRAALGRLGAAPANGALHLIEPVGYLEMIALETQAAVIATDSGGVQKEAYFHGVPCLTLRESTEWTELVEAGANRLVGADPASILDGFEAARATTVRVKNLYGDGRAASAIADRLTEYPSTMTGIAAGR